MDLVDRVIHRGCPFVAGGVFIGSVYWTAVTYGAVTVMQVRNFATLDSCCPVVPRQMVMTIVAFKLTVSTAEFYWNTVQNTWAAFT